jgi:tetrahydromethanopterin S-methyltransferase subunit C
LISKIMSQFVPYDLGAFAQIATATTARFVHSTGSCCGWPQVLSMTTGYGLVAALLGRTIHIRHVLAIGRR